MKKNNFTFKMKMDLLRFKYRNKKIAISYLLLILLGLIVCLELNYFPSIITHIIDVNKKTIESFKDIYINTGIALIGFSVITITLQTYNQQSRNDYMNSVAEKIFDTSIQNYIYSCYIFALTLIFLMTPNFSVFSKNFQFFYFFYYVSILIIFLIFMIELIVIKNSSKSAVLRQIENTTMYYYDFIEKVYSDFEEYCNKKGLKNSDKVDFVNSWNTLMKSNIQLSNSIIRQSINDPLLFANGMDYYIKVVERRLQIRKNKFHFFNIPLIMEITPLKDNDYFIEKYILEYLDEYSNLALQNKNRDILDIIQNVYLKILILGKDNRYSNSEELELTIKVAFSYYIDFIKNLVLFGNENSLISCYDSFKELFINNYKEFSKIVDDNFYNKMVELSDLALKRKSLMNYRTIQGLIVLPAYSIVHSKSSSKEYELNMLFNCLKKTISNFDNIEKSITNTDGARIYLEYVFNTLPSLSLINIITEFYSLQIKQKKFDNEIVETFLDFINSDEVCLTLLSLNLQRIYTSGIIYCRQFIDNIIDTSINLLKEDDSLSCSKSVYKIIYKCICCLEKYSLSSLESNGLNLRSINNFYERIIINGGKLINNKVFNDFVFNNYMESLKKVFNEKLDKKKNFENFYFACGKMLNYYLGDRNKKITEFVDWYISLFDDSLAILHRSYRHLAVIPIGVSGLNYDDEQSLLEILETNLINTLNSLNLLDIKKFIKNNKLSIKTNQAKSKLINCIIEESKKKLLF